MQISSPQVFRISSPRIFQVAGVPAIAIEAGAQEVHIAGDISYCIGNRVVFRLQCQVGKFGGGAPHRSHYRRVDGHPPIKEEIAVNRRGSAASIIITMEAGHEFEARGYARNSEWQRFRFDGNTVVRV